jgi:TatD DNase family protein
VSKQLTTDYPLVDIGVNLTSSQFKNDRSDVITRALAANVTTLLVTGTDLASSKAANALCEQYPLSLRHTCGVHPHDANGATKDTWREIRQLSKSEHVCAIGEMGLDFNRNFSTPANQIAAFTAQLEIAVELQKPVFLHERDAFDTQYPILKDYRDKLCGGVVHCFTGNAEQLKYYLDLDLYIGITGWVCDPKRGSELYDLVKLIPSDRLLIETDAPYLMPKSIVKSELGKVKSRRNEPCLLPWILNTVCEARGDSYKNVAVATADNARRLFRIN